MVYHTKLISLLIFSPLRNNTKRWLSAYLKGGTASCRYNFTLSPSFHTRVGVPQESCISPTLFIIFVSTYVLANSYADNFKKFQMFGTFTTHVSNIGTWADERYVPKSTITLFTSKFAQSSIYPRVTLNYPLKLRVTFDPYFSFKVHV